MKCRTLALLVIVAALAVPAVLADGADATNPQYTVTLLDYDGVTVMDSYIIHGQRSIVSANATFLDGRPYWYDRSTGYEWPADKVVTRDLVLIASETQPTQEPVETPLDLTPYLGAVFIGLVAVGLLVGYRRLWNAS